MFSAKALGVAVLSAVQLSLSVHACLGPSTSQCLGAPPEDNVRALNQVPNLDTIFESCAEVEYDLFLYVEEGTHLDLIALPALDGDDIPEECEDALAISDGGAGSPIVEIADNIDGGTAKMSELGILPAGTFSLDRIQQAMASADVIGEGSFDILTDNCATFIISMYISLDIPITKQGKRFVVEHLAKNKDFVQKLRESPYVTEILRLENQGIPVENIPDKKILWHLVSQYVNMHKPAPEES